MSLGVLLAASVLLVVAVALAVVGRQREKEPPAPAWFPSAFVLAQEIHFFAGLAFGFAGPAMGLPWWSGAALILAVVLLKEVFFDPAVEKLPFLWNGVIDWSFYAIGVAMALILFATA